MTDIDDPRPEGLPPHKTLTSYYDADPDRSRYVFDLFNATAQHYDTIERLFGNGGLLYRRLSMRINGLKPGMRALDVATGTGNVAVGAVKIVGPTGQVFCCDPNPGMLREARKKLDVPITRGVAQELPFKSNTFDFLSMGIALRHVSDLKLAFSEYVRVLKPGGKLWILEGHVARSKLGHVVTRQIWGRLVPWLTKVSTGSEEAKLLMDYYWDTVDQCVPPEEIVDALAGAGFEHARMRVTMPGAFCEYKGQKPLPSA